MPRGVRALSSADRMKFRLPAFAACLLATALPLLAQTTTVAAGIQYPTQNSARANGVNIQETSDGTVWFLEASADIIARLKDGVIRQWQIRPTSQLGANPVYIQLDGDHVFARLDTTTGALTEWVVPGTIPATFYRAPDGLIWLPQTAAVLQSLNLDTLEVVNYRSTGTYSYADMVVGPDGAFWLADFGDNRIVRWVPGDTTETSWLFFDLNSGRLNPSQISFDDNGRLWISQRSGNTMDLFDPPSGNLFIYEGITAPYHFQIVQGRLYITSISTTSTVSVLDPQLALPSSVTAITPATLSVACTSNLPRDGCLASSRAPVTIRQTVVVPTDFTTTPAAIDSTKITTVAAGTGGILTTTFPFSNTYGIDVVGGRVWVGSDGQLLALNLQTIGDANDQSVPMATSVFGSTDDKVRIDLTLTNHSPSTLGGQALYLFSPGSFAPKATYSIPGSGTLFLADAFGNLGSSGVASNGPVRLNSTTGTAANLLGTVRSLRVLPSGGTFGYLLPAQSATTSLVQGSTTTLFTGADSGHISILNVYSLDDAKATLSLFAPDGTLRGTQDFDIAKNATLSYNPAASAFGVAAEPGDAIRVQVTTGTLQTSVLVFDPGTIDVLPSLPAVSAENLVLPWVGAFANGDRSFASDLYLSNPSADTAANVQLAFYGVGTASAMATATLSLAPLQTLAIPDFLDAVFGIPAVQGALTLHANTPIAAAASVATHVDAGDYGTFASALDASGGVSGASAFAVGLPQTATRSGIIDLFNTGAPGDVTLNGFKSNGTSAGTLTVHLDTNEPAVISSVFGLLGVSDQDAGRVRIDVPEGMRVFGWNAATDNVTGDIDLTSIP
jgi:streptogramin lyase